MSLRSGYPIIERPDRAILFRRHGVSIGAPALLRDAQALAARLPPGRHLLNLCYDRYAFTVGFLAALIGGRICLLSGDRSAAVLAALLSEFPDCIALLDDAEQEVPVGLPAQVVAPEGRADGAATGNAIVPADRLAAIVFTSGSTGRPVGHAKRWGALVERSIAAGRQFDLVESAPTTVVGTVPPQHMYGFETTVLLPLHAAAASWCGPAFFPEDVQRAIASVPPPAALVTTPLQLRALLGAGTVLPAPTAVISATAPLDATLAVAAEQRWNTRMLEIFGATEVGSIASRRTLEGEMWSLYPTVALHAQEDRVIVSAPHAAPCPLDDRVELLDKGRFRLLGRRADIVKLGGRRASLAGLNHTLLELAGVEDGTFILPENDPALPAARLMAVVVAPQRSAESILHDLRGRIDPLFLPRRIIRVSSLQRNEFGKLSRARVLAMLRAAPDDGGGRP